MSCTIIGQIPVSSLIVRQNQARRERTRRRQTEKTIEITKDFFRKSGVYIGIDGSKG